MCLGTEDTEMGKKLLVICFFHDNIWGVKDGQGWVGEDSIVVAMYIITFAKYNWRF